MNGVGKSSGFTCMQCGNCCRIQDGIVRLDTAEIARIAAFLGKSETRFIEEDTDVAPDRRGLVLKNRNDSACAMLTDDGRCRIHPVKPDKCKSFPYEWTNPSSTEYCEGLKKIGCGDPLPDAPGQGRTKQ